MSEFVTVTFTVDREEMRRRGRLGALAKHSRHDPRESTQKAREAFKARFEREVDPDGTLPPEERARRAEFARKAYFQRMALQREAARKAAKKTAA